ncbi:hypothetical protein N5D48_06965 [Pseudomonas sp. GD03858]|uniref:hypothetical protein n=1 Tax=unclassified Pseudomonas TaxID=196821 RepID=UPI00244AF897|nr:MULTISPECIES: hypothetical protein [unclassified Pseudomonas]MDH0648298.1 hypothetical protein [Pseudomonas sp. GD03867]MDH0662138.1 hypothetical protein [Pseudomonas sp. GD03858]
MQVDKTYHVIASYGIAFDVHTFVIAPEQCCHLRALSLPFVHKGHYQVVEKVAELYDRMLPGKLPCHMRVAVSRPLSRLQGDLLNEQRHDILNLLGASVGQAATTLVGGPAGFAAGLLAGGAAGTTASQLAKSRLPTFHAGDVLVSLYAQVNGGIGPQTSSMLLIIQPGTP